jgi:hypothetical protein
MDVPKVISNNILRLRRSEFWNANGCFRPSLKYFENEYERSEYSLTCFFIEVRSLTVSRSATNIFLNSYCTCIRMYVLKNLLKTKASMPSHNFYIRLYKNNINVQSSIKKQKQEHSMREFHVVGFNGAIGSPDATHIAIKNCCYQLRNNNLGPKQHLTTCIFNLTVNHWCRILSTTVGYPAR